MSGLANSMEAGQHDALAGSEAGRGGGLGGGLGAGLGVAPTSLSDPCEPRTPDSGYSSTSSLASPHTVRHATPRLEVHSEETGGEGEAGQGGAEGGLQRGAGGKKRTVEEETSPSAR